MIWSVAPLAIIPTSYKYLSFFPCSTQNERFHEYIFNLLKHGQFPPTGNLGDSDTGIYSTTHNLFVDQLILFLQAIRDIGLYLTNNNICIIHLFSNRCDSYRPSLREAFQKSLTLWKLSQNITALTFPIGAEGTYSLFLTLVCHSRNPFIVALGKPHFIWGGLTDPALL